MPYKNPEDKQRWEREHREQRNASRRRQHSGTQMEHIVPRSTPDPISQEETQDDWTVPAAIVFALLVCLGLLVTRGGVRRRQHLGAQMASIVPRSSPDPISEQEPKGNWRVAAAIVFVLVVCIGLLVAIGGVGGSLDSGPDSPSA